MANAKQKLKRPLSPHLQVYRLPLTAKMSILHRMTGIVLALGSILVAAFLIAAALGEEQYNIVMGLAQSKIGAVIIFGWSLALFYHLCNGIRHMFWDVGIGVNEKSANFTSAIVILVTLGLTVASWWCGCQFM